MTDNEGLKNCPFCGCEMYEGIGENVGFLKHPMQICVLSEDVENLWYKKDLWNTRAELTKERDIMWGS